MSRADLTKLLDDREKFFEDNGIVCACDVGRHVCQNCITYYSFMGKFRLKIRSKLRRFTGYE